jgi:hypothetical protein
LSYYEANVRYIETLQAKGFLDEAELWRARYSAACGGVMPEERSIVIEALKSYLTQYLAQKDRS